ncbi:MAG TPA: hypothetical protein VI542_09980 [Candidatus Tectomicrobia bacterium]
MVAVKEISWEEASAPDTGWGSSAGFEHTTRHAFRAAVDQVAARAKATLPECNGRVEKAVAIVLAGDVELLPDGHARVASQCQGALVYRIVNGTCDCPDFPRAPASWCKHRIAAGIQRRAMQAVQGAPTSSTASVPSAAAATHPLPEAPASANCHVITAGRQVQVTLRDTDEARLLSRLTALLALYPLEPAAASQSATREGWCQVHQVQMHRNEKDGRSWWSHKVEDGSWGKGKAQGQGR